MADKITGYGRNGVDITSARSRGAGRQERAADSEKTETSAPVDGGKSSSQVRLTDAATSLKQIETRLADLPDVDQKRVDSLRQRIESGQYEVNAGRLADRLLAFERDLA